MKRALASDLPCLLEMMAEFYAESGYALNRTQAEAGFLALFVDERLGGVWMAESGGKPAGYIVLTLCFSMEYAGVAGFVDDLYVRAAYRRGGVGAVLLQCASEQARARGVRALFVEVSPDNAPAQRVYRRFGFRETDRQLLALPLAAPSHHEAVCKPQV